MTDSRTLEERLPALLERAAPQPPRALVGASIRSASSSSAAVPAADVASAHARHRRAWRWAAPTVVAIVVIAIAVTAALVTAHHRVDSHRGSAGLGPHGAAAVNAQRHGQTAAALQRLLAAFSVPSAWRPSTRSLSKALAVPRDDTTSYLVSRARLWATTDAADTAMSYLSTHLPFEITASNATKPTPNFASAVFTPSGRWTRSGDYAAPSVSVVIQRLRTGAVGVKIEASAYWLPVRTPAQTIPASVTGAAVVIKGSMLSKIVRHDHLNTADARTLAHQINRLAVTYQGVSLCPVPGPSATLKFASPEGSQTVTVSSFCSAGVFVQPRTPGMQIDLAPARTFRTLLTMLHLPANFGRK
ncbi:MAG TPA: hypothetical protein VGH69_21435 [Mycobacterium sp.]